MPFFYFITFLILSVLFSNTCFSEEIPLFPVTQARYHYMGSYKTLISKPEGKGPFPVIIYNYDEFYDWAGKILSDKKGYRLEGIATFFSQRGYVCVIPIERFRRVNAIIGVTKFLKKKGYVDTKRIHLVGMSEGGFMSMVAAQKHADYASMILIAPIEIHDKGYLSRTFFLHQRPKNLNMPVFFMFVGDVAWRIQSQQYVYNTLDQFYESLTLKTYYKEKRWFWKIDRYGDEIHRFILNNEDVK